MSRPSRQRVAIRWRPWSATEGRKNHEASRRDVCDGNVDGATDHVYMLEDADRALLKNECSTIPDDALDALISILGPGPASGLRILASILLGADEDRARVAAEAVDAMSETHTEDMAMSIPEAARLERYETSASLASVVQRAFPSDDPEQVTS